jgi:predicted nucleic acid-binding protein
MILLNGKKKSEMNGKLVDVNILIYLSKRKLELEKITAPGVILSISVITYMEVLGFKFEDNSEKYIIEQLCKYFPVTGLNQEVVDKVIAIRQQHKIKLPDAIILATAIISDMELVTANVTDFIHIEPRLKIYNPMI